ncbi:TPA: hypothetical protein ACSVZR_003919 [Bacillus cereus]
MTNSDMEKAIKWIKYSVANKRTHDYIMGCLSIKGYTETEIRYCYVLATGKNMAV